MPLVVANGIRLNYEQTGTGPDVVMVHGLGANLAFWYLKSVPLLRRDFRITMYDLRGHGRSEMPPSGYTPTVMADDLEALLDVLRIERIHLIGHSFGGVVALELALRRPARLTSLTIADTRLSAFQPALRLKDWPHFETWRRHLEDAKLPIPDPDGEADFHLLMYERLVQQPATAFVRARTRAPVLLLGRQRRAVQRWLHLLDVTTAKTDLRVPGPDCEHVQQLVPPALAIFGELSHCLPTGWGLRAAIGCQTVIVPRVGHFFPLTRPRLFAAALRDFWERVPLYTNSPRTKPQEETAPTICGEEPTSLYRHRFDLCRSAVISDYATACSSSTTRDK
jgi:pimeloyl-ACP methyl ester carboxylesterase